MIGNPDNLVRVQARIERMQHPTRTTHAEIQFQVTVTVPCECGHPVAEGQFQPIQGVGNLA